MTLEVNVHERRGGCKREALDAIAVCKAKAWQQGQGPGPNIGPDEIVGGWQVAAHVDRVPG